MDAYRPYMRPPAPPPPSSSVDPNYHQYQQQAAAPPRTPHGPWFPNQFQHNTSQSPSTPPPPTWAPPPPPPPPHFDHPLPPAYPSPPHPYPPHHAQLLTRPYLPPLQHLSPYPPQDWSGPNWGYQQDWNHQTQSNVEDWAARAKAWVSAKAAMVDQQQQAPYGNQYPQAVESQSMESQSMENHQHSSSGSAHKQYPPSATPPNGPPVHWQENQSIGARPASYLPDGRMMYSARDGPLSGDPNVVFHPQEQMPASQSVHQQEVPSSYSSVSGKEESRNQSEKLMHLPSSAAQEGIGHLQAPAADGSIYPYGNQHVDRFTNLSDQPLEFASRFNRDQDLLAQSVYAHHDSSGPFRAIDHVVPMASVNMWTSSMTPDVAYPSIPTVLASGSQQDPAIPILPPVSGRATPSFPRFSGPSFQPSISPPGGPFGLGSGQLLPPTGGFSADSYALPGSAERPKKASVPNWLREEIIKTKASITSSSLGHPKDEAQSVEDDGADKSFEKDDQADRKSINSTKSTEEEEDDQDYVEAARTAAINQEIKRVLTEILLKVTDELFDEIATKVLNEDGQVAEDNHNALASDCMVSSTSRNTPVTRASAKAPFIARTKNLENEDVSEKSSSSAGGNILGLANYASDDEDGDMQTSNGPNSTKVANLMKYDSKRPPLDVNVAAENGTQPVEFEEHVSAQENSDSGYPRTNLLESKNVGGDLGYEKVNEAGNLTFPKVSPGNLNGKMVDGADASLSKEIFEEKVNKKSKLLDQEVDAVESVMANAQDGETRLRPLVTDRDGNKRTSIGDSSGGPKNVKVDEKLGENQRSKDGHPRNEKTERNDSKETKDLWKHGEKMKESEDRKRPGHSDIKEDRKDTRRPSGDNAKDDSRREQSRDKEEDISRHKASHDLSSYKRIHSSSRGSGGQKSRNNLAAHGKDSSNEDSDNSRRKLHSRKRNISPSPSPIRSRRRQVSRSPRSKHSQRRHSPYSSLVGSRERRRSRSRSPVRRHR